MFRWILLGALYALMSAHCLFHGLGLWLCALPLVLFSLLLVKRRWALRLNQVALVLMSGEWVRTTTTLILTRIEMGEAWMRAGVILGVVALITLWGAALLQSERVLKTYR